MSSQPQSAATMPRRFLSKTERERLSEFPPEMSDNDLIVYFTLTPADMAAVQQQRRPHTQLGFALLLGTLRYLGFFPAKWDGLPEAVVAYVAQQVTASAESWSVYLARAENRREQFEPVMQHLGFRRPTLADQVALIEWLGERALENERPSGLLQLVCERLYYVRLVRPAVSALPASRLKYLAQLARHTSSQGLQRKRPVSHQQAILVAFLHETHQKLIDELIDLFDRCLAEVLRKARRELQEYHLAHLAQVEQVVSYFQIMSEVVLDDELPDQAVRSTIYSRIAAAQLQTALAVTQQLRAKGRLLTDLDFFDRRYSYFRRFGPGFLAALTFQSQAGDDPLLAAITVLRELNVQSDQLPAVLTELRQALRSGVIWVADSRRYAALESYLIPEERWPDLRLTYSELVGIPLDGWERLASKQQELEERLARFDAQLPEAKQVRLEEGRLVLSPLRQEDQDPTDTPLSQAIGALLPLVQSGELLAEVDSWTQFSAQLTHAGGASVQFPQLARSLYAIILAQAGNMDLRRAD